MTGNDDRMDAAPPPPLGVSGRIARFFLTSQLTLLIALVLLFAGVFAIIVTPREEEPQIDVTMANVLVPFPGASAADVERLVAIPAEQVLSQIQGLEHVWSVSKPGQALITVQYKVGVSRNDAVVRLHDTILSHRDWLPPELGVGEPLVKPKGIDDVPIVALTLVLEGSGHRRVRPRARRARGRGGTEARPRHPRGHDDRRARTCGRGATRSGAARRARSRRRRGPPRAAGGQRRAAGGRPRPRQRDDPRRRRRLPAVGAGRPRPRRRRARRPAGVPRRRRARRRRSAAARRGTRGTRPARAPPATSPRVPGRSSPR